MEKFTGATIIITALNETDSLKKAVEIVLDTCHHDDLEEILLTLAKISTKECIETAETLAKMNIDVPIKLFFQTKPYIGGAFMDAFMEATGSHVVMLAADMDTDPNAVHLLIEKSKQFPDRVITANRWKKGGGFVGYSKVKKVCNYIFNRVFAVFYLTTLTDMTYGYRLLPTKLVKSINWEEYKHPFYLETALKPLRLGKKFIQIPAVWRQSEDGKSVNSFFDSFKYFKPIFHNRFISKDKILKENYSAEK